MSQAVLSDPEWGWMVRLTYNEGVIGTKIGKRGAKPGDLAIETVHTSEGSRDIEVAAAEARGDVDVSVVRLL